MKQKCVKGLKKLLSFLLVMVLIMSTQGFSLLFSYTNVKAEEVEQDNLGLQGSGTESDPYLITNEEDLWKVTNAASAKRLVSCYKLTSDIELTRTWMPIGDRDYPFAGILDGDKHKIIWSNLQPLTYSGIQSVAYFGFFGCNEGIIKNLSVSGYANCIDEYNIKYAGCLIAHNSGTVINCCAEGVVNGSDATVGGLIGENSWGMVISCYATNDVYGEDYVGGLIGYSSGTITSCYATGDVKDQNTGGTKGGLIGRAVFDGEITDCYATGNIYGSYTSGGLIGNASVCTSINNCYATGNVYGCRAGGLIGHVDGDDDSCMVVISDCYATGDVCGYDHYIAETGGLVGRNEYSKLTRCYATGNVSCSNNKDSGYSTMAGGLVGINDACSRITNCYATGSVNSTNNGTCISANISNSAYAGGLIGSTGYTNYLGSTITNCYATGDINSVSVMGTAYIGGIVGNGEKSLVAIADCYYDSKNAANGAGIAVSLNEMKLQSTYENWDFEDTWIIDFDKNGGLPYLRVNDLVNNKNISSFELDSSSTVTLGNSVHFSGKLTLYENAEASYKVLKSVFDKIQWTSSNSTIVADDEIICSGPDLHDTYTSNFFITFIPKKVGTVTITGRISDELTVSCVVTVNSIISSFEIDEIKNIAFVNKTVFSISGILELCDNIKVSDEILTSEVEAIKWTSSDQSIVKDSDISCIGENSSDYQKSDLEILFTPQKEGKVTITGTTSSGSGLVSSCNINIISVEFSPGNNSFVKDSVDGKFILTIKTNGKIDLSGNPEGYMVVQSSGYKIYGDGEAEASSRKKDSAAKQGIFINKNEHSITFIMPNLKRGEVAVQFIGDFLRIDGKTYETAPVPLLDDSAIIQPWKFCIEPDSETGFSFENKGDPDPIEKDIFKELFPKSQANKIYKQHNEAGKGGLCFGMSLVAAGLSYGTFPEISDFDKNAKTTWDLKRTANSSNMNVSLLNLLRAGQIAQWLPKINNAIMEENASKGEAKNPINIKKLVDAAKTFINSGNNPVVIGITTNDSNVTEHVQHALLVLDVKETSDNTTLILYDSNTPGINSRLELYKSGNSYTGEWNYIDYYYRSYKSCDTEGTFITFCQPLETFKQVYNSIDKKNYNQYLLETDKNVKISKNNHAVELSYDFDAGLEDKPLGEKENNDIYWVDNDSPLILGTDGTSASFDIIGNETSISFENINSTKTEITSSNDNFSIRTDNNGSESPEVTYDFYIDDKVIRTEFQLDTKKGNLTISNVDNNIYVKGIDAISITQSEGYMDNDGEYVYGKKMLSSYNTLNTNMEYSIQIKESIDNNKIDFKDSKGNVISNQVLPSVSPSIKPSGSGTGSNTGSGGGGASGGTDSGGGAAITPTPAPVATLTPSPSPTLVITATTKPSQVTNTTPTPKPSASTTPGTGSDSIFNNNSKKEIISADVTLNKKSVIYNGKEKKPGVTVLNGSLELIKDKEYTVSYLYNINVGTAYVTVYGEGNYYGSVTKSFKIIPKGTPVKGKVKPKHKGFIVKWKKQPKSITGYQVQYSTSKNFIGKTTVIRTVKKKSITKLTAGRLKAKKKYYVRVRTYKTVKGKKYYSRWSKSKVVKTKK